MQHICVLALQDSQMAKAEEVIRTMVAVRMQSFMFRIMLGKEARCKSKGAVAEGRHDAVLVERLYL